MNNSNVLLFFSKEEVEKCKEKDLLEEMLREMTGEFPQLSQVFVKERDFFLANSLRQAARPIPNPEVETGKNIYLQFLLKSIMLDLLVDNHLRNIDENE